MVAEKNARPVKPLAGEKVTPQAVWTLEKFTEQAARAAEALDEQVLAQMRAELQPRLDAEIAQLKEAVRAEAHASGYEAGFEEGRAAGHAAGYEVGLAEARSEIERLREAAGTLISALEKPLDAWDEALTRLVMDIIQESLRRFLVADTVARAELMRRQLMSVLREMNDRSVPVTVQAHPQTKALLSDRLDLPLQWREDETFPPEQVVVHQDVSQVVIDWQRMLDQYLNDLAQALREQDDEPSADPASDSKA